MKFIYEYRTKDNVHHEGVISAASREAAFDALRAQKIKPGRLVEAPGFFNKLFGKGKRWMAIAVLVLVAAGSLVFALNEKREAEIAQDILSPITGLVTSMSRRQLIGDTAIIEKGIRDGWTDVFAGEGERFLASFAVPGVPAGLRNTTEEEINAALKRKVEPTSEDTIEVQQIKAMVEGMKQELREFIADGGSVKQYGRRLVQRQEQELGYYSRAKAELDALVKSRATPAQIESMWQTSNTRLRKLGIRLLPMPERE